MFEKYSSEHDQKNLSLTILLAALGLTGLLLAVGSTGCGDEGCNNDAECAGDRECEIATGECLDPSGGGNGDNGGGSDNGDNGGSDNGDNNGGNGNDAHCCYNGEYFDCPDQDTAQSCVSNFDPSDCDRDASLDSECGGGNGGNDNNQHQNDSNGGADIYDLCQSDSECASDLCVWEDPNDAYGFCTETCDSWSDCPTFSDCVELGNAPADVCVED